MSWLLSGFRDFELLRTLHFLQNNFCKTYLGTMLPPCGRKWQLHYPNLINIRPNLSALTEQYLCIKLTIISCHRCLISSSVNEMKNCLILIRILTTKMPPIEQHALKYINSGWNIKFTFYLEISGGQNLNVVYFFNTSVN